MKAKIILGIALLFLSGCTTVEPQYYYELQIYEQCGYTLCRYDVA